LVRFRCPSLSNRFPVAVPLFGIAVLQWDADLFIVTAAFSSCLIVQYLFIVFRTQDLRSLKSALISALSLCLMLKTNSAGVMLLAGTLAISSKFLFTFYHDGKDGIRKNRKHFFNPTNFGIIITMLLTSQAWISPGQWGTDGLLLFSIGTLGLLVLLRVKRLDTALTFLFTFAALGFVRMVLVLGWESDVFLHQFTNGTLLLFTFFMITDPVSTPAHKHARILWATLVGVLAFYLATYEFVNGAPLWALFCLSPLTFFLDKIFVHKKFSWL
jgi:hypothetical protein